MFEGLTQLLGEITLVTLHEHKKEISIELLRMIKTQGLLAVFALSRAMHVHVLTENRRLSTRLVARSMETGHTAVRPLLHLEPKEDSRWGYLIHDARANAIMDLNWAKHPCQRMYEVDGESFLVGGRSM